jgi:tripartite-type tricarboxylate transporter receptor subunit TctC
VPLPVPDFAPLYPGYESVEAGARVVGLRMQRFVPAVIVLAAACVGQSVHAQEYFKGKTVTLFAGQPPGGGIDSEMRLVAHYFGKFIPGEPVVIARNMQGAGGLVLGNHLYNVARPDGLTLGMPGRSGFVLAPAIGAGDVKYDLRKLTWIGSSASTNYILWLRRGANIRSFDALKAA